MVTAEELIEKARTKEEAIKTAKKGMRKESIDRFKSYFTKPMPVSGDVRRVDKRVSKKVRKAVHLAAPAGSMVKRLTSPPSKKVSGRGRGRPKETYKVRFVPGVGRVKVPTHVYKRMMSKAKADRRLAEAQRQANVQQQYEAEQIAMQQDPRFQQQDAFLESPDMEHEQNVMEAKQRVLQQQQIQQIQQQYEGEQGRRPSVIKRAGQMFSNVGKISLMGIDRERQVQDRQVPQIRRPDVAQIHRPQLDPNQHQPRDPQVLVTSGKSPMFSSGGPSILNQPNELFR